MEDFCDFPRSYGDFFLDVFFRYIFLGRFFSYNIVFSSNFAAFSKVLIVFAMFLLFVLWFCHVFLVFPSVLLVFATFSLFLLGFHYVSVKIREGGSRLPTDTHRTSPQGRQPSHWISVGGPRPRDANFYKNRRHKV